MLMRFTCCLLALFLLLGVSGCASHIGERIARAPNVDRPSGIFDEELDQAWERHAARHYLVDATRIATDTDGTELYVAVMPAGDYPNRVEVVRAGDSLSMQLESALPVGPPRRPARGTIVAIHGWQGEHRALLYHAMSLAAHDWDVVVFDQRGHGRSGGRHIGFGVREAADLVAVVEWAKSRAVYTPPLILFGASMGASTALLAAPDIEPDAVVAIAPFARIDRMLPTAVRRLSPLLLRPFLTPRRIDRALAHAERLAGIRLSQAAPIDAARTVHAPVLLVQSTSDKLVTPDHGRALHAELPRSTLHELEGYSHEALMIDRNAVLDKVIPWLDGLPALNAADSSSGKQGAATGTTE